MIGGDVTKPQPPEPQPRPPSARRRLHHAIRNEFTESIAIYYRDHPGLLTDPLAADEVKATICATLRLLDRILAAVDKEFPQDRPA